MESRRVVIVATACAVAAAGAAGYLLRDSARRIAALEARLASPQAGAGAGRRDDGTGKADGLGERVGDLAAQVSRLQAERQVPAAPPVSAPPADLDAKLQALALQIATLARDVDVLEQRFEAFPEPRGERAEPPRPQGAPEAGPRIGKEAARERSESARARRSAEIAARHAGELRDEAWARQVESALRAEISATPKVAENARIEGLDCRTSLCRVAWTFSEGLSSEEYFELENEMAVVLARAGLARGLVSGSAQEAGGAEGYFSRDLPRAPSAGPKR